jgi:multiple sugar transport system permease protein
MKNWFKRAGFGAATAESGENYGKSRLGNRRVRTKIVQLVFYYVMGLVVVLFFLFPLLWVVSLSLKKIPEIFSTPLIWFSPKPQWGNYLYVIKHTRIFYNLLNSLLLVTATLVCCTLVVLPASYTLSRSKFNGKKAVMMGMMIFQMISPVIIAIPLYRFFSAARLINNYPALIAVYAALYSPFAVWFMKGYFDSIPIALDEAAKVDGCSRFRTLVSVLFPVAFPGVISVSILIAVQSWGQLIIPFILLDRREYYPVSVGLLDLQASAEAVSVHFLAASSIIAIAPVIILFVVLQKFIIGALTNGAVKG